MTKLAPLSAWLLASNAVRLMAAALCMLAWHGSAAAADIQQVRSPGGIAAWLVQ